VQEKPRTEAPAKDAGPFSCDDTTSG
jgi:hypothetical protein